MRAPVDCRQRFEFSTANGENSVLVETQADRVVIRAAHDTIPPRQKWFFIRHLAAEGFIPERYQWFADVELESDPGLTWTIDAFWTKENSAPHSKPLRQILRLIFWASLAWLASMAFAVFHSLH